MTARTPRHLFGPPAAMLLIGSAAAGEAKAAELDRDLLSACADFQRAEAAVKVADDDPRRLSDTEWERLVDVPGRAWQRALEAVRACPAPRTPEGLQAKSQAAYTALRRLIDVDETNEAALALDCLTDVMGRAGA